MVAISYHVAPFQLLELNIISAQDLSPVARNMKAYAVAWVRSDRKLSTRVDTTGRSNPTWNDKFVFRVDDGFLYSDTSAVMIEIYATHWLRDLHVGTVRVLVGNLIPPPARPNHHHHHHPQVGMRFAALQVRRQSGRPQGILNIGVALLDSSMRSMPLYTQLDASAVAYRHLMGEEDPPHFHQHAASNNNNSQQSSHNQTIPTQNNAHQNLLWSLIDKPELRRTKSDTSSMIGSSMAATRPAKQVASKGKASSMISGSEPYIADKKHRSNKKGNSKPSSVISGVNKAKTGKTGSVVNALELVVAPLKRQKSVRIVEAEVIETIKKSPHLLTNGSGPTTPIRKMPPSEKPNVPNEVKKSPISNVKNPRIPTKPLPITEPLGFGPPKRTFKGGPFLTESELGPSPSEVAAAILANNQHNRMLEEGDGSVLGEWSLDSSVEGLQSKLERWRAELPPVYDINELSSYPTSTNNGDTHGKHSRRHTDDGGLFSCFSNICGIECSIVCGSGGSNGGSDSVRKKSSRMHRSPSADNVSFL